MIVPADRLQPLVSNRLGRFDFLERQFRIFDVALDFVRTATIPGKGFCGRDGNQTNGFSHPDAHV